MTHLISRRGALIGGASLAVAASPLTVAFASPIPPLTEANDLLGRVKRFLATLDTRKAELATFAWDGPEWRSWNYFGGGSLIKPGLRLEQMSQSEKDATWHILEAVLSPDGLTKARNVMLLQDILAASGNGRDVRSSQRFSIAIFGKPEKDARWGVRVEGHHLSLSFAVDNGQIVSVTPAAFAALPNRVLSGRHRGLNTLQGEEKLARRLQADLAGPLQARAQLSPRRLFNILSYAGRERANAEKIGVAAADMNAPQRELLYELIKTYAVDPYTGQLATAQEKRLKQNDLAGVYFAWYGPNKAEESFGYRVIGDNFVIELGCIDRNAQHLHPIYHDLGNTLGQPHSERL